MAERVVYQVIRCACCERPKVIAEFFTNADYPEGAIRIIPRHNKEKKANIIDLRNPSQASLVEIRRRR